MALVRRHTKNCGLIQFPFPPPRRIVPTPSPARSPRPVAPVVPVPLGVAPGRPGQPPVVPGLLPAAPRVVEAAPPQRLPGPAALLLLGGRDVPVPTRHGGHLPRSHAARGGSRLPGEHHRA